MEFTHRHIEKQSCRYLFRCTYTNTGKKRVLVDIFLLFDRSGLERDICSLHLQMHSSVFLCFVGIHTTMPF